MREILRRLVDEREPDPDALERERLIPMGEWTEPNAVPLEEDGPIG
jgi:hypothetical protein